MEEADAQFRDLLLHRIERDRELEEHLDRRLAELQGERDLIRQRRVAGEDLFRAEFGQGLPTDAARPTSEAALEEQPGVGPLAGMHWIEAITTVMKDSGEALHVREIWERLQDGGFQTNARDPIRSIVSFAVRDRRIVRDGPNRYTLIGVDGVKEVVPHEREAGFMNKPDTTER
jgi:hypothetical protein